jgi:hypothetical protein
MSAVGRSVCARKNQRRTQRRTGHQSGERAVKRDLPRSHLHRAAPSLSVLALPSSDGRSTRGATPYE